MRTTSDTLTRIALGAAGGLAGTLAIQALMAVSRKALPGSSPPMRGNPGQYMVEQAEEILPESAREQIPDAVESAAAQALGLGYGVTFGALYAALRPRDGDPLTEGAVLGAVCWAAGYLGWLPALGLMPPVGQQTPEQVLVPAAEHVAYGVTTVAAYDWLRDQV